MLNRIKIRPETKHDFHLIENVIKSAFQNHPFSNQTEHNIVNKLRSERALNISLVAEFDGIIVGHIAFSEVRINGKNLNWYGLAPVSVIPNYQNIGIGSALINKGIEHLKEMNARGCVLVGEPDYYMRFGFNHSNNLYFEGVPKQYFMMQAFGNYKPKGEVTYHAAFSTHG